MNLLFEIITGQIKTGAGEYMRRLFYTLLEKIKKEQLPINMIALYDSSRGIAYEDLRPKQLSKLGVKAVDVQDGGVLKIISDEKIDKFFISCGQYACRIDDFSKIPCETICVVHDLCEEEEITNGLDIYLRYSYFSSHLVKLYKYLFKRKYGMINRWKFLAKDVYELYSNNPKCQMVTVSEYSKASLACLYPFKYDDIMVLSSPIRVGLKGDNIKNKKLQKLVKNNVKFYLLVSADRPLKNAAKTVNAFHKYAQSHPDEYLVTVGYPLAEQFEQHIVLPFLSDSDLAYAYSNCYALIYASIFEGYGYPPMEVFSYGKPVIASNATSIPEVLGDAPIYFSPFYETGIFKGLLDFERTDYKLLCERSLKRYEYLKNKQNEDLKTLINLIIK